MFACGLAPMSFWRWPFVSISIRILEKLRADWFSCIICCKLKKIPTVKHFYISAAFVDFSVLLEPVRKNVQALYLYTIPLGHVDSQCKSQKKIFTSKQTAHLINLILFLAFFVHVSVFLRNFGSFRSIIQIKLESWFDFSVSFYGIDF